MSKVIGMWPRLDGAPPLAKPGDKSYDSVRRKVAHSLGMDFLFTQREYYQSIQTDKEGSRLLINSSKTGKVLVAKPVPQAFEEKPWFRGKFRFPREYLGIPKIEERIKKLSYLVHVLAQHGLPNRAAWKSALRLSKTWYHTRYEDMRKHVKSLTLRSKGEGRTRSPWKTRNVLSNYPVLTGEKIHESGIVTPLWSRTHTRKGRVNPA